MRSRSAELLGKQEPAYLWAPPAPAGSAGSEMVDLAASAGLHLDPAQALVLEGAAGERRDGTWAAGQVGVVMARQNGKGSILEARQIGGLYLLGERLQTHTAHRFDTCLEHFRRVRALIDGCPDLSRRVKRITTANGEEAIELRSGQRLIFKARAKGSGRGFTGAVIYFDESFWLGDVSGMIPTLSAMPNPQLWYTSSAPLPRSESDTLRSLIRRGRSAARGVTREPRLFYAEWCASADPGPPPVDEPDHYKAWLRGLRAALAEANPAYGVRITDEFVIETELREMGWDDFARERLGIFPEDIGTEPVIDEDDWRGCRRRTAIAGRPVFAYEVSVDRKSSVICAAGRSNIGGTHVELVDMRKGTGWLPDRLLELQQKWLPTAVVCNPAGPAGSIKPGLDVGIPELKNGRRKVRAVTGRDYQQACAAAVDAISEHRWRHLDQPELTSAALGSTKRTVGDAFVFDRRGTTDISPFLAAALAAWVVETSPAEDAKRAPILVTT